MLEDAIADEEETAGREGTLARLLRLAGNHGAAAAGSGVDEAQQAALLATRWAFGGDGFGPLRAVSELSGGNKHRMVNALLIQAAVRSRRPCSSRLRR